MPCAAQECSTGALAVREGRFWTQGVAQNRLDGCCSSPTMGGAAPAPKRSWSRDGRTVLDDGSVDCRLSTYAHLFKCAYKGANVNCPTHRLRSACEGGGRLNFGRARLGVELEQSEVTMSCRVALRDTRHDDVRIQQADSSPPA